MENLDENTHTKNTNLNKKSSLKESLISNKILIIDSKNDSMESLLERHNSILKNEKPELGKGCFDNSNFKEDDYNSLLNLSRNHLNESLDDRKNKLLKKSVLSNEMSNNYDYSLQKIVNKSKLYLIGILYIYLIY